MKALIKLSIAFIGGAILFYLAFAALLMATGCASTTASPKPEAHPIAASEATINGLHAPLVSLNVLGLVGAAIGLGIGVYGALTADKLEERLGFIAAAIGTALMALSFTALILMPFALWILGIGAAIAVAAVSYVVYVKYFRTVATSPKVTA
jgi:hypothetical protein